MTHPWKRSFQFRPFAVDVFGAYGGGATVILQQLARKRSEHTSMAAGACKRLALPVPQSRTSNRERADVAIEETFNRPSFPHPSTAWSRELL
jgi:hypothetical protein